MANLTPQGGNADLAGRTVTTIDGYTVTYDNAGFARRSVSPNGEVKNYDSLGNQTSIPQNLEVSPAVDPTAPVLPVSTQMPISDVIPQSFFQRDALPPGSDTFPTPAENLASLREAGFGPAPVTAADQANIDALNRIEANRANNIGADTDAGLSPYGEQNDPPDLTREAAAFDPNQDEFGNLGAASEAAAARAPDTLSPEDVQAGLDEALAANATGEEDNEPRVYTAEDLGVEALSDEAILAQEQQQAANRAALQSEDSFQAAQEAAFREKAKEQATFQARYKQPSNQDWRVRLSLGPNAQYLYNAGTPRGSAAGILGPLTATDGVIFPYTPSITTTYSANYEQYDLVHSNYRGIFYKNSRVGDINIRGTFTAQDTNEANYLLAVIHFFRSATKMFYGQDAERGTPPPVCLLNGLGTYQFSDHPVVISSFNYTTPNDVDYIRAQAPNNYGSNLLNRRAAVASNPGGSSLAGLNRLLNAVQNGLSKGALPNVPAPGPVNQTVNNTAGATYVPTKIEVDITLIPVQTRSQVSKQFSLKGFANGQLLKGGFW